MEKRLFVNVRCDTPDWVVKEFFNTAYQQNIFLDILENMVQRLGYGINDQSCFFSHPESLDPSDHYIGVRFRAFNDVLVVTEREYERYLFEACQSYIAQNENDRKIVEELLKIRKTK